jgi:hypothetical protein
LYIIYVIKNIRIEYNRYATETVKRAAGYKTTTKVWLMFSFYNRINELSSKI